MFRNFKKKKNKMISKIIKLFSRKKVKSKIENKIIQKRVLLTQKRVLLTEKYDSTIGFRMAMEQIKFVLNGMAEDINSKKRIDGKI
jgi:uncharacterized protein YeeX (DUF496 family)